MLLDNIRRMIRCCRCTDAMVAPVWLWGVSKKAQKTTFKLFSCYQDTVRPLHDFLPQNGIQERSTFAMAEYVWKLSSRFIIHWP